MPQIIKKAFTLIELLVVIAIIGILSGLIVVSMQGLIEKAKIAKSQVFFSSLKNILIGNVISEWKFDGVTASGNPANSLDVLDTWGGNNNGTVAYPPTIVTGANCISGSCLQFDGVDDYVDFGNDSSLSMRTGDQTISFWVKFDNALASQYETLFTCGADAAGRDGYWIRRSSQNRLQLDFNDGTLTLLTGFLSASDSLVNNTWYSMVIVFDRDIAAQAYINGVKQSDSLNITSQQGDVINFSNLRIGAFSSSLHRFQGIMDEVRIYNAIMPISQIKERYYIGLNSLLIDGKIKEGEYLERINSLASNE